MIQSGNWRGARDPAMNRNWRHSFSPPEKRGPGGLKILGLVKYVGGWP